MKKSLAVVLLVIGSALAVFGAAVGFLCLVFVLYEWGVLIAIVLTLAAAFGIDCLRRLFRRKYGLNAGLFFLCAYMPSAVISMTSMIVFTLLDDAGYFSGMFAALGEFLMAFAYIVMAFSFAAAGGIWLVIMTIVERKRSGKLPLSKPAATVTVAVGGAVIWTVWLFASSVMWSETESLIPPLLILSGITLGIELLRYAFAGVRSAVYYACAYYAAVLGKAYSFYVYFSRLSADSQYGFPTDADKRFFLWYEPIEAAAVAAFAVLWFVLFKLAVWRRERL